MLEEKLVENKLGGRLPANRGQEPPSVERRYLRNYVLNGKQLLAQILLPRGNLKPAGCYSRLTVWTWKAAVPKSILVNKAVKLSVLYITKNDLPSVYH